MYREFPFGRSLPWRDGFIEPSGSRKPGLGQGWTQICKISIQNPFEPITAIFSCNLAGQSEVEINPLLVSKGGKMKGFVRKAILLITIICLCEVVPFQVFTALAEKQDEKPVYIGMDKCKDCHPEHVKTYSGWKYSKNFRILEMRDKAHDPECLRCHTTGYGKPGGFESVKKTPHMKNVQCEACHGPASLHVKAPTVEEHLKTLSIPRNICTSCHHQHKHMGY